VKVVSDDQARRADEDDGAAGSRDRPSAAARELVRATGDLAGIAASLLLALYPAAELYRVGSGAASDLQRLILDPAPADTDRLRRMLLELVDRPEWRGKHAVTREVSDDAGERLEVLTPLSPSDYREGPRLVGPFATERDADEWGADHAVSTLSYDTFFTGSVWLCDLFDLPARA